MEICFLEKRLLDVKTAFERQLTLLGRPGYDPTLTMSLKKDFAWLEEQKELEMTQSPSLKKSI